MIKNADRVTLRLSGADLKRLLHMVRTFNMYTKNFMGMSPKECLALEEKLSAIVEGDDNTANLSGGKTC